MGYSTGVGYGAGRGLAGRMRRTERQAETQARTEEAARLAAYDIYVRGLSDEELDRLIEDMETQRLAAGIVEPTIRCHAIGENKK